MSLRATLWAYDEAPVMKPVEVLVLIALADEANAEGRNAFPSVAKVAARARVKPRAAKYALRALEDAGVIVKGDQDIAARHIARADRRPTVYDLCLSVTWESTGTVRPGSEERGAPDAPRAERGARDGTDGVHESVERGAPAGTDGVHDGAPDPTKNPTENPKNNPSGDAGASRRGTRITAEWQPTDEMRQWFREQTFATWINPLMETQKFVDYWIAQPGQRGVKVDWVATWRNWMRTAAQRAGWTGDRPANPDDPF